MHRVHQQLSYLRNRHKPGDSHDADLASMQAELESAKQALPSSNVGFLKQIRPDSGRPPAKCLTPDDFLELTELLPGRYNSELRLEVRSVLLVYLLPDWREDIGILLEARLREFRKWN